MKRTECFAGFLQKKVFQKQFADFVFWETPDTFRALLS